ncbi:protein POLYCHOME-like [Quillaja saponaria]|uniref:Protein POLYCHOME-like n=1 Tax=Quillaja saponaria TaxID=32244 RepID=A0AAD7Q8I7_QUISA|nr:protein POLYCHOME-like [Quillaja saponaria]
MPESRDRLPRPIDVATVFSRRRAGLIDVESDEAETVANLFGSPIRPGTTATTPTRIATGFSVTRDDRIGRYSFGTPRTSIRGRNPHVSPIFSRENSQPGTSRRGRGRARNSVLPSWYPRTPLRDITAVVRAIERRRARLRDIDGLRFENPVSPDQGISEPMPISGAQLEHDMSLISPKPSVGMKPRSSAVRVQKILQDITNKNDGEPEFLRPQKKLLNSIDRVEKDVMEELQKMKRTPSAKKAEREKRVRTLMSMR